MDEREVAGLSQLSTTELERLLERVENARRPEDLFAALTLPTLEEKTSRLKQEWRFFARVLYPDLYRDLDEAAKQRVSDAFAKVSSFHDTMEERLAYTSDPS